MCLNLLRIDVLDFIYISEDDAKLFIDRIDYLYVSHLKDNDACECFPGKRV